MFASLVLSCGKSTRKMGFCRDECGSSHQGVQDPNATLTKQRVESSHSEVRGCGLPSDELFRFIETQIGEGKVRSDKQYHSTTEDASPLAEFKVTRSAVLSARSQQQLVPSVLSKTDIFSPPKKSGAQFGSDVEGKGRSRAHINEPQDFFDRLAWRSTKCSLTGPSIATERSRQNMQNEV